MSADKPTWTDEEILALADGIRARIAAAQTPSVPVEIGPPLTFNGHGNFDLEPESSRRPSEADEAAVARWRERKNQIDAAARSSGVTRTREERDAAFVLAAERFIQSRPVVVDATVVPMRSGRIITPADLWWFVSALHDEGLLAEPTAPKGCVKP